MELGAEFFSTLVSEGVSFAVLVVVLFGVYRLTNRMVDVLSKSLEACCRTLDRIADALEKGKRE